MKEAQKFAAAHIKEIQREKGRKVGLLNIGKAPINSIKIVFNGEEYCSIKSLAKKLGVSYTVFWRKMKAGRATEYLKNKK